MKIDASERRLLDAIATGGVDRSRAARRRPSSLRWHREGDAQPPPTGVAASISRAGPPLRTVPAVQLDIMRVTIQLPDDISAALEEQWDDVPRRSLEAIAVEGYLTAH